MCPELDCAFKEQLDRVLRIAESADMGQVAAGLDRKHEARWDARRPGPKRRAPRHPIERDIELDGVE